MCMMSNLLPYTSKRHVHSEKGADFSKTAYTATLIMQKHTQKAYVVCCDIQQPVMPYGTVIIQPQVVLWACILPL